MTQNYSITIPVLCCLDIICDLRVIVVVISFIQHKKNRCRCAPSAYIDFYDVTNVLKQKQIRFSTTTSVSHTLRNTLLHLAMLFWCASLISIIHIHIQSHVATARRAWVANRPYSRAMLVCDSPCAVWWCPIIC